MELRREVAELYQEHAADLLRYACSLSRNPDVARDAVQETFLRYFVERRYGRQIEKPRSWLQIVMRNYLFRRLSSPAEKCDTSREIDAIPADGQNPEALLHSTEMARNIAAQLSERERQCLNLRVEGLGYTEIAGVLGVRPGTVGALLARVHSKVRRVAGDEPLQTADAVRLLFEY